MHIRFSKTLKLVGNLNTKSVRYPSRKVLQAKITVLSVFFNFASIKIITKISPLKIKPSTFYFMLIIISLKAIFYSALKLLSLFTITFAKSLKFILFMISFLYLASVPDCDSFANEIYRYCFYYTKKIKQNHTKSTSAIQTMIGLSGYIMI